MQLKNKPWETASIPDDIYQVRGLIAEEERRCLYWLATNYFKGKGYIVDLGPAIGASTFAMARGLRDNKNPSLRFNRVFAYDLFANPMDYLIEVFCEISPQWQKDPSGDFLHLFLMQTSECRDLIVPIRTDLILAKWIGQPIELLFIDAAKYISLNSAIFKEFITHLIPGHSLVIQQDFHHLWLPHIHVSMAYLDNYFEVLDSWIAGSSRLYILKDEIPSEKLARVVNYDFSKAECVDLIDSTIHASPLCERAMLTLVKVVQFQIFDEHKRALSEIARVREQYSTYFDKHRWLQNCAEELETASRKALQSISS